MTGTPSKATAGHSAELLRLAERVEGLTGPDREIDVSVWLAVTPGATREPRTVRSATNAWPDYVIDETRDATGHLIIAPFYSSSLDAAVSLMVERSLFWSVCDMEDGPYAQVIRPMPGGGYVNGLTTAKAATPALALAAACLRARAAAARGESRSKSDE